MAFPTSMLVNVPVSATSALTSGVLNAAGVKGKRVVPLPSGKDVIDLVHSIITADDDLREPFFVLDLDTVVGIHSKWNRLLETVKPFYAVKCNPEPALLGTLAALGAGFDCASPAEIDAVLALGVPADRIIYANPCKPEPHIAHVATVGVGLTTFDSVHELDKLRRCHPKCSLLLRLRAPDESGARWPLGSKFGALPEEVDALLEAARSAGFLVLGVSFHVGSGATDFETYRTAIASARAAFDAADRLTGHRMHILNIGGGFSAGRRFEDAARVIKSAIPEFFGDRPDLVLMAEPGRLFAETTSTLATTIIGKRVRGDVREYWINDGIYGSMSCMIRYDIDVTLLPLACHSDPANPRCHGRKTYASTVFGPTCDARDIVLTAQQLPELEVGDWLVSPNMGAYTASVASNFCGFLTSNTGIYLACSKLF